MFSIFTYIMSRVTHSEPGLPMVRGIDDRVMQLSMLPPRGGTTGRGGNFERP